jgi:hypothetical protein
MRLQNPTAAVSLRVASCDSPENPCTSQLKFARWELHVQYFATHFSLEAVGLGNGFIEESIPGETAAKPEG